MVSLQSAVCQYLGFVLAAFCSEPAPAPPPPPPARRFGSAFEWTHVNFTWPSAGAYARALAEGRYVPQHNVLGAIKFHKERMYAGLPRVRPGSPVTLAVLALAGASKRNPLLTPFPTWEMNDAAGGGCGALQDVQALEIDRRGLMWVLDGRRRHHAAGGCAPKLLLLELAAGGRVVGRFAFSELLAAADLVLDDADGGYAYIADGSAVDPGLVVFARRQQRAWKLRDRSMFGDPAVAAADVTIAGVAALDAVPAPIDGIALSPLAARRDAERVVYFGALGAHDVFAVSTRVLRDEQLCLGARWRHHVKHVGTKTALSDGMIVDNGGRMYFGLLDAYGVAEWSIYAYFDTAAQIDRNDAEIVWPMSFAIDMAGYLYVLCNSWHKFVNPHVHLPAVADDVRMRVMKLHTGAKSYMFTP